MRGGGKARRIGTVGASAMARAYLEPEEVERLEQAATNLRDRLLIMLLSRLGCRISEARALTVEDVDFERAAVTVVRLKTRLKLACPECNATLGRSHTFCPKCGVRVERAAAQAKEQRRLRTLRLDASRVGQYARKVRCSSLALTATAPDRW